MISLVIVVDGVDEIAVDEVAVIEIAVGEVVALCVLVGLCGKFVIMVSSVAVWDAIFD